MSNKCSNNLFSKILLSIIVLFGIILITSVATHSAGVTQKVETITVKNAQEFKQALENPEVLTIKVVSPFSYEVNNDSDILKITRSLNIKGNDKLTILRGVNSSSSLISVIADKYDIEVSIDGVNFENKFKTQVGFYSAISSTSNVYNVKLKLHNNHVNGGYFVNYNIEDSKFNVEFANNILNDAGSVISSNIFEFSNLEAKSHGKALDISGKIKIYDMNNNQILDNSQLNNAKVDFILSRKDEEDNYLKSSRDKQNPLNIENGFINVSTRMEGLAPSTAYKLYMFIKLENGNVYLSDSVDIVTVEDIIPSLVESNRVTFNIEGSSKDNSLKISVLNLDGSLVDEAVINGDGNISIEGLNSGVVYKFKVTRNDGTVIPLRSDSFTTTYNFEKNKNFDVPKI